MPHDTRLGRLLLPILDFAAMPPCMFFRFPTANMNPRACLIKITMAFVGLVASSLFGFYVLINCLSTFWFGRFGDEL